MNTEPTGKSFCNIGGTERIVRIVAGAVLTSLAFWGPASPWFFLGLVPLATGIVGWCPPYALLGINTAKNCNAATPAK